MTCQELADLLSDYLAEDLSPHARAAFEAHLQTCPDCARYFDSFREVMQLVRQAARDPLLSRHSRHRARW
ncbi:MAG: zf-HC2 domain-containing protein [Pirellulales bacterium]|nr:zf-HC2 domain-containing protein [Pirellulales bacterium]